MDAKLTLKLDGQVVARAKRYAKKSGQSLSRLVERYFASLGAGGSGDDEGSLPITASLIGIISEKAGTYEADEKAERLARKHK